MNQEVFDYFAREHGLILTESEYAEIQRVVSADADKMRTDLSNECTLATAARNRAEIKLNQAETANCLMRSILDEVIEHAVRRTDNGGPIDRRNIMLSQQWRMAADAHRIDCLSDGALAILRERIRQINEEGYTRDHDAGHEYDELLMAADTYLQLAMGSSIDEADKHWPWFCRFKAKGGKLRMMVKAGALLAAAMDRVLKSIAEEKGPECLAIAIRNANGRKESEAAQ